MPELVITKQDIEALAAKLERFSGELSDNERALLAGMFHLAGEAISAQAGDVSGFEMDTAAPSNTRLVVTHSGSVPAIHESFAASFSPLPARANLGWSWSAVVV